MSKNYSMAENVVERVRTPQIYYHERFPRVPTIDKCGTRDQVCRIEANEQYVRDKLVDSRIVTILRSQMEACNAWYDHDKEDKARFCSRHKADYEEAAIDFHVKYGDVAHTKDVVEAFMKQKHRLLWERRHGPVGMGRNGSQAAEIVAKGDAAAATAIEDENMIAKLRSTMPPGLPKEMRI